MTNTGRLLLPALTLLPILAMGQPVLTAKSAIIVDAASGKVLWEKDADTKRYPASTTKIMTGMLLLERCLPNEIIVAPKEIETITESSMYLKPGEKVTAKDMLYAVMLRSANDGSYAVAKHISGSVAAFSKLMNQRAEQLGCTNTNFNNPNGLNDENHWTTARDLSIIARQAMRLEPFREVAKTKRYTIDRSLNKKDIRMVSRNKWLFKDITADGIKTGYTRPAGYCYVGSATRNGFQVITVLLASKSWQEDHKAMLDWSFGNFEKKVTLQPGQALMEAAITSGAKPTVSVSPSQQLYALGRKGSQPNIEVAVVSDAVSAPIQKGQKVGEFVLTDGDGFEQRVAAIAAEDVPMATVAAVVKRTTDPSSIVIGSALIVGAVWVKGRSRRRMRAYARRRV